ncbi:MAG: TonB-dependent receptor [Sphingomonadales bacterium]|nr:MAG: TonB-dependent receptor [Sphingomonadales bacterium]TNF02251.1 MAG: TonB-dependent receptor [Sphingomonadales bacterium]
MHSFRSCYRAGSSLAALFAAVIAGTSVQAQQTPPEGEESRAALMGGDIVVTARKREERAQDIPIAISAFSGDAIAARGIEKVDGVATFTPNMTFQNNPSFGGAGSSAAIYIRGIGQKEFLPTTEPGVGVYVDGVYVARSVGALLDLVDVERVEILRGPQGTLFGRNTIGGALSITTRKPDDKYAMTGQLTVGRYNRIDAKVTANVPLTDTLYSKLSVASFKRDGYVTHLVDNRDLGNVSTLTGRIDLRWVPSDALEINLSAEGTRDRSNGPALVLTGVNYKSAIFNPDNLPILPPGSPATPGYYVLNPPFDAPTDNFTLLANYFAAFLGGQPCIGFNPYNPQASDSAACFSNRFLVGDKADAGTAPQYSKNDTWGVQGSIDWDLGPLQLKSITAYRKIDGDYARDGDHSSLTILHLQDYLKQKQFSQELQLLGDALEGKLKYVAGLYYFNEKGNNINNLDFTPVTFRSGGRFQTKSYAAFAQGTWSFVPSLDLTLGLRYTDDRKSFLPDQEILVDKTGGALIAASPNTPQIRVLPYAWVKQSEDAFTPMANLAWHATRDVMFYASYSKGFKSGGFVQRVFPPMAETPRFSSEKATAYELGFKSSLFDRKLTLNGAVFYTKYDNLQVQVFTGIAPVTKNAAQAEIKGAELEARLSPGGGWFVEGSLGYLDPEFTKIDPAATEITLDSKFERVAKWTVSASLSKSITLPNDGEITARGDWSYRSGMYMDALNSPELYQPGYSLFNANLTYDFPGKQLSLVAAVTNIANKKYSVTGVYGSSFGLYEQMFARPREWSLSVKWKL